MGASKWAHLIYLILANSLDINTTLIYYLSKVIVIT